VNKYFAFYLTSNDIKKIDFWPFRYYDSTMASWSFIMLTITINMYVYGYCEVQWVYDII